MKTTSAKSHFGLGAFWRFWLISVNAGWQSSLGSTSEASLICLSYESIRRLPGSDGRTPFPPPSILPQVFAQIFPIPETRFKSTERERGRERAVWISPSPLLSGDIFLSRKVNLAYLDLKKVRRLSWMGWGGEGARYGCWGGERI